MNDSSYRTILRSSSIIGGAQIIDVIARLVKIKVAAVLLGPAGVGLIGIYTNLIQTAGLVAGLGINNVGTRQVATVGATGIEDDIARVRRALFWGALVLASLGATVFWLLSDWIAHVILSDDARSGDVKWLAIGVALTVAAGSQGALLMGMRRLGDVAWITAGSSVVACALGIFAISIWQSNGLLVMVLVAPALTYLFGIIFVARRGRPTSRARPRELAGELGAMAHLGLAFMVGGVISLLGPLIVRVLIQRELGSDPLGQFQAAWAVGALYLGFVLSAMGTDYFPRLTATIHDRPAAVRLINQQTEVALLLCAPALVAMLGFAPWVIRLLYSADFDPAVGILRWQLLGDILRAMSWPLGFVLQAVGAAKIFLATEFIGMAIFVSVVLVGLPLVGLPATGIGFLVMYIVYLPIVWWFGRRMIGFKWTRAVKLQAVVIIIAALIVDLGSHGSLLGGAICGGVIALLMGFLALIRLSSVVGVGGKLAGLAALGDAIRIRMTRLR